MKKALSVLCAMTMLAFSGTQAYAADYEFRSERSDDFYKPSSAKLESEVPGKFRIIPDSSVITSGDGYTTVIRPDGGAPAEPYPSYPQLWQGSAGSGNFTYSGNRQGVTLGTLRIPSIGLTCTVYEGESLGNLAKGAGHFTCTSLC